MLLITHTPPPSLKANRTLPGYSPRPPWQMSVRVAPPTMNWGLEHNSWKQLGTKHESQDDAAMVAARVKELYSHWIHTWKKPGRSSPVHSSFYCWGPWSPEKGGVLPTVTQPGGGRAGVGAHSPEESSNFKTIHTVWVRGCEKVGAGGVEKGKGWDNNVVEYDRSPGLLFLVLIPRNVRAEVYRVLLRHKSKQITRPVSSLFQTTLWGRSYY